jgi:hypothetical protein
VTPIAGLLSPSGEPYAVPPPPAFPGLADGPPADATTVPGAGIGCDALWGTSHGFVVDAGGLGWLFGTVPPGAEQGTARFANGTETPVPFHDGLFVLVHPAQPPLKDVVFTRHGQALLSCDLSTGDAPFQLPPC